MTKLLHLKHWQLFLLLFGVPFLLELIAATALLINPELSAVLVAFPILVLLFAGLYLAWLYVLGVRLHQKFPGSVHLPLARFKLLLAFPVVYFLAFMIYMGITTGNPENMEIPATGILVAIIPLHLFAVFCILYCLYFVARELKSVEWQRPVTFNDFAGEFFLIWFYPVGVWFIQPRINKLFGRHLPAGSNLSHQLS